MSTDDHKQALPAGFRLGSYRVARVLGVGGFGVTYLCEHAGLGVQVAVKEYLPNEIAVRDGAEVHPKSAGDREGFEWGLSRFLDEARTLARLEHPNVVRVRDCFEANNTAYIVMDYEDGEPLDALLRRHGTLTEGQLKRVVLPVVDGLRQVHAAGFLHRDIKPSNIFVRRSDESPVLLDFGSARQALGHKSRSLTAIASPGYSPPEQYERTAPQGAWTDIYALSALCYRAITGNTPMGAPWRQSELLRTKTDPLPRLAERRTASYSPAFLEAVDWGLRLIETERPHNLDEWLRRFERSVTSLEWRDSALGQANRPALPQAVRRTEVQRDRGGSSGDSSDVAIGSREASGWLYRAAIATAAFLLASLAVSIVAVVLASLGMSLDRSALPPVYGTLCAPVLLILWVYLGRSLYRRFARRAGLARPASSQSPKTATVDRSGAVGRLVRRAGLARMYWLFGFIGNAVFNFSPLVVDVDGVRNSSAGSSASAGIPSAEVSTERGLLWPSTDDSPATGLKVAPNSPTTTERAASVITSDEIDRAIGQLRLEREVKEAAARMAASEEFFPARERTIKQQVSSALHFGADALNAYADSVPIMPPQGGLYGFWQDVAGGLGQFTAAGFSPPFGAGNLIGAVPFGTAIVLFAMLYWLTVMVGIWWAARVYQGWRGWAILAQTHVVVQAAYLPILVLLGVLLSS